MQFQFSPQLIDRLQRHFHNHYNLEVSQMQAEAYLHSFADLFLAFTPITQNAVRSAQPQVEPNVAL